MGIIKAIGQAVKGPDDVVSNCSMIYGKVFLL